MREMGEGAGVGGVGRERLRIEKGGRNGGRNDAWRGGSAGCGVFDLALLSPLNNNLMEYMTDMKIGSTILEIILYSIHR